MQSRFSVVVALLVSAVPPVAFRAQADRVEAALVLVDGVVSVNDRRVDATVVPVVLPDGASVRTARGRAVVALKRGGWLFLDNDASARVLANGVYNFNRIEVLLGSAIVASATSSPIVDCESSIRLSSAGWFRFVAQPVDARGERPCQFRVYDGAAAVPLVSVTNSLRAGQSMTCNRRCGDMIPTQEFSPNQLDEFDRWARRVQQQVK